MGLVTVLWVELVATCALCEMGDCICLALCRCCKFRRFRLDLDVSLVVGFLAEVLVVGLHGPSWGGFPAFLRGTTTNIHPLSSWSLGVLGIYWGFGVHLREAGSGISSVQGCLWFPGGTRFCRGLGASRGWRRICMHVGHCVV